MNLENSKTSDPHRLKLNLAKKIYLQSCDKHASKASNLIYYNMEEHKILQRAIILKYQEQHGMKRSTV